MPDCCVPDSGYRMLPDISSIAAYPVQAWLHVLEPMLLHVLEPIILHFWEPNILLHFKESIQGRHKLRKNEVSFFKPSRGIELSCGNKQDFTQLTLKTTTEVQHKDVCITIACLIACQEEKTHPYIQQWCWFDIQTWSQKRFQETWPGNLVLTIIIHTEVIKRPKIAEARVWWLYRAARRPILYAIQPSMDSCIE